MNLERIILDSPPVRFLSNKSKKIVLPGFEKVPLYDVTVFFFEQVKKVGITERASAISYNFIMAIPPTILFLLTLIPNLPFINTNVLVRQLKRIIRDIMPSPEYNQQILDFIDTILNKPQAGVLSFGFLLLIFFASNGMMGLMRAFNKNYIGFEKRTGLQSRWTAIKLTLIIMGLIMGCLLLLMLQGFILRRWLGIQDQTLIYLIRFIRWFFIVALIFYAIAFIYKYAPAIQKRWKITSPGAILATTLSIITTLGFSVFINNFGKYNALYGSIGTIIVLMTVIYINSLVLLIGYELNVSIHSIKALAVERQKHEAALTTSASLEGEGIKG